MGTPHEPVPGRIILWLTSRLVPEERRREWLAEWKGELAWEATRQSKAGHAPWRVWLLPRLRAFASASDAWSLWRRSLAARTVASDVRLALRQFHREPLVHGVIVLTLALTIGANTAIFSVVHRVLQGSLPFHDPDRVVRVWMRNVERDWTRVDASLPDFEDWQSSLSSFAALAAYNPRDGNLGGLDGAQRIEYALVTPDFFRVMGVQPTRGRFITPSDDIGGADDVIVISHAFWTTRLGGSPDAIGRTLRLDGRDLMVIGIAPAGFAYPTTRTEAWKPLAMHGLEAGPRGGRWLSVVGRLADGVDVMAAGSEVTTVTANLQQAFAATDAGWDAWIEPVHDVEVAGVRTPLLLAWAAVFLVLIVAVANVANLQLARTLQREREIAVRGAIGAGRSVIIRQLLVESVVLAVVGGALGVLLARPGTDLVARLGETTAPIGAAQPLNAQVLLYTSGIALLAGVLTGLLPALRAVRGDGMVALGGRGEVHGRSHLRAGLVVIEVALAVTVLTGAGLLVRSLNALRAVDVGIPLENRLTLRVAPSWADLPERSQAIGLYRRIEERIRAIPAVVSVGAANRLPLEGRWWTGGLVFRDRPAAPSGEQPVALNRVVTPGYAEALGLRLKQGRFLSASDAAGAAAVVLVSESLARRHWPGLDPLGQRIAFAPPSYMEVRWHTVVGVVSDAVYGSLEGDVDDVVYTPFAQASWGHFGDWGMGIVVATAGDPLALLVRVREAIAAEEPSLPVYDVRSLAGRVDATLGARQHATALIAVFAALALLLAAVGTYAVIAFNVRRQTREIGLRLALGESPRGILRRMLGRGMAPAIAGIGLGLPAGWLAARSVRSQLFGVEPLDVATFGAIAVTLVAISFAASWLPARHASRLGPLNALRTD